MTHSVDYRDRCSGRHGAKVVSKSKDWPIVADGTKFDVLSVGKNTVVDELSSNNGVLASLVCHRGRLKKKSA